MLMGVSAQSEPAFERIVVFGDSLSDTGNAGRFSNGPVWVEILASRLGVALRPSQAGGSNFAVGGARLDPGSGPDSLRAQVDLFLRMSRPSGRTLTVVYGGANDLLHAVGDPDAQTKVDTAVASLLAIVADLVEQGVTDLLVPNLPDVGITPEMQSRGRPAVEEARRLSERFNGATDDALRTLAESRSSRLYRLDVHAMAEQVRKDPASLGFMDVSTPCEGLPQCEGYVFWDRVHPTTQAHGRLAEAAFRAVLSRQAQ